MVDKDVNNIRGKLEPKDQYNVNKTSQVTKTQRGIRQPKIDANSIVPGEK